MEENNIMGIFEIISAIILIVACVFIIIVVLMAETKTQMSQAISGGSSDNFFQKNAGKTKEARLNKATVVASILFFVLALAVNVINVHFGGSGDTTSGTSSVVLDSSSTAGTSSSSDSTASTSDTSSSADSAATESTSSVGESTATSESSVADSTVSE